MSVTLRSLTRQRVFFPKTDKGQRYKRQNYSAAIVRTELRSAIEDHPLNETNYGFKAEDVAALIDGSATAKQRLFWRDLVDGQMDADRMDYLLRDSFHAGVQYGKYDLNRLVNTVRAIPGLRGRAPRLGISEGGWHAAEGLVLARYFMFTRVFFHKTRVAYDVHLRKTVPSRNYFQTDSSPAQLESILNNFSHGTIGECSQFSPTEKVGSMAFVLRRETTIALDTAAPRFRQKAISVLSTIIKKELGGLVVAEEESSKSWYKTGTTDIPVVSNVDPGTVLPLSKYSHVVLNIKPINQVLLYVRPDAADDANKIVRGVLENERNRQGTLGFTPTAG